LAPETGAAMAAEVSMAAAASPQAAPVSLAINDIAEPLLMSSFDKLTRDRTDFYVNGE
jgi:hypothetical protein